MIDVTLTKVKLEGKPKFLAQTTLNRQIIAMAGDTAESALRKLGEELDRDGLVERYMRGTF